MNLGDTSSYNSHFLRGEGGGGSDKSTFETLLIKDITSRHITFFEGLGEVCQDILKQINHFSWAYEVCHFNHFSCTKKITSNDPVSMYLWWIWNSTFWIGVESSKNMTKYKICTEILYEIQRVSKIFLWKYPSRSKPIIKGSFKKFEKVSRFSVSG